MALRDAFRLLEQTLRCARHFVLSYSPRSGISDLLPLRGLGPGLRRETAGGGDVEEVFRTAAGRFSFRACRVREPDARGGAGFGFPVVGLFASEERCGVRCGLPRRDSGGAGRVAEIG